MEEVEKYKKRLDKLQKKLSQLENLLEEKTREAFTAQKSAEDAKKYLEVKVSERTESLNQINKELKKEKHLADQANRAKSLFLANMSHEIRTPMNSVIGSTSILMETDLNKDQVLLLKKIKVSGDALLSLVNDILDFSKIEAGELALEEIDGDLEIIVDDITELFSNRFTKKKLDFLVSIDPNVPQVIRCDPTRLKQIIINLVSNAHKFTDSGYVKFEISRKNQQLIFAITDSGPGIKKDRQDSLFQSFAQEDISTTRNYGGTGLGLSISKELVHLMGGKIGIQSELGKGSTFYFEIPLHYQQEVPFIGHFPEKLLGKSAMIVDKNNAVFKSLKQQLENWGLKVEVAADAEQALQILSDSYQKKRPMDIALISYDLPKMSGLQLGATIKLKSLISSTKLALFSDGESSDFSWDDALKCGFLDWIRKPVKYRTLRDLTVAMLEGKEQIQQYREKRYSFKTSQHKIKMLNILVVEDNPSNQELMLAMLERDGHQVMIAENGRIGVQKALSEKFDLVFMDCQMPELDGFQATQQIRTKIPDSNLPIIALTANALKGDRIKCLESGMNDYVTKPVTAERIRGVLSKWQSSNKQANEPQPPEDLQEQDEKTGGQNPCADLDLKALQMLESLNILKPQIELFHTEAGSAIQSLEQHVHAAEHEEVKKAAHKFKTSAGIIGAKKLTGICQAFESASSSCDTKQYQGLLESLKNEYSQITRHLKQLYG